MARTDSTTSLSGCKAALDVVEIAGVMAEREGFEPSMGFRPIHTFQACSLSRSDTSPGDGRTSHTPAPEFAATAAPFRA